MTEQLADRYIRHQEDFQKYAPPGHGGTVNVRLFDNTFCENFEMILGELEPGGIAERHHHDVEHQAIYVLSGEAQVTLADDKPCKCGPGSVIQLPPKLDHHIVSLGPEPLKLVIVYSPPLPKRADQPLS